MEVAKGQIIFHQGSQGDYALLIEKGQVEIFHTKSDDLETHLAVLGEGELFGEMALFDTNIRSAGARALSDCTLLVIRKDQLFERVSTSDKIVQLIIRILMRRLKQQNEAKSGVALPHITGSANDSTDAVEKLKYENQINEAFLHREFRIYHQPMVNLESQKIVGSEALIRWESPTKGLISPGAFVDILENSSMIVPVGYWIIEECFIHHKKLLEKHPGADFSISINVSGRQLLHYSFVQTLRELTEKHKVDPSRFKLEITERILVEGGLVIDILNQCHELGFHISLDDFGTGFSSLQYLARMPIDFIKIDRSFTMNVGKDVKTLAIVDSIIYLAKKLNIRIIAEGIETEAERQSMRDLGCEYGQGYLFSKPLEFSKFLALI